ncbi:hypothetical protein Sjap_023842 [Stephania japonica]|uniref:non-specific serine/threonine protein kinase n=1 Tax=Stephania japonica TaxID=461633 RepID=A0AAP0EEF6_9MAGN
MVIFQSMLSVLLKSVIVISLLVFPSLAQLAPSESRILLQVQELLEYPPVLQSWTNWTNFCYIPPTPSLTLVCQGSHVTELTVIGNRTNPSSLGSSPARMNFVASHQSLSPKFSIDLFFTVLTKLSSLKVLKLVSLGLWGPLPAKINRFWSLQVLNMTANLISGTVPPEIVLLTNLRSLVLAGNLLQGSVPDLRNLKGLHVLDVSSNFLGPQIPSLGNTLVNITLRNNTFRSQLPPELFKNSRSLRRLDLSYNELSGQFPSSLLSLSSIQYLNLAGNKLMGALPMNQKCSDGLAFVDLSFNLLSGKLPMCLKSNSSNRVVIYSWNCLSIPASKNQQHPSSFCHQKALAVKPTEKTHKQQASKGKLGLFLGVAGATIGALGALSLIIFAIIRRVRSRRAERNSSEVSDSHKASARLLVEARNLSPVMRLAVHGLPPYRVLHLEEIEEATDNFNQSNVLGGSQGDELYRGRLRDGSKVVVRCFKLRQRHSVQNLSQHMEVISKFRHRHLVSALGHCIDILEDHPNSVNTVFLVFEYVSNGTLRSHLDDSRRQGVVKWPQRLSIAIGIAKGIQFLHTAIAPGSTGNDLKIEHVLLDENLTPKISGYSLRLPSMVGSESNRSGEDLLDHLSSSEDGEKQDIYQLGVILVELITGKPIASQSELDVERIQLEQSLAAAPSSLRSAADPSIHGSYAYESLRTAAEITINCLSKDAAKRPTIEDVLWNLQYSVQVQDGWTVSGENPVARS